MDKVWILDSEGKKVSEVDIEGPSPTLEPGQTFSLKEFMRHARHQRVPLEQYHGTASVVLRPDNFVYVKARTTEYRYDARFTSSTWEDLAELRRIIARQVYDYEPVIHKPVPPEPPRPEDPSAWRMIRGFARGVINDLRRLWHAITWKLGGWKPVTHELDHL
jgi:hypothetical protein